MLRPTKSGHNFQGLRPSLDGEEPAGRVPKLFNWNPLPDYEAYPCEPFELELPVEATAAQPGTAAKIAVMASRAMAGLSLFHSRDNLEQPRKKGKR